jgi:hypothetical protein
VEVEDTSPPGARFEPKRGRPSPSLEATRARLQHAYGAAYRFECGVRSEGAYVRFQLPYRTLRTDERPASARAN